ncbi:MAG: glycosyltransferase [Pseudomonadota bacterium]
MAQGFLQVLGLIRWSYPSNLDAFQIEAATLADLRAELYAPARLEERLFYLEHLTLPCLAAQTDKNFRVVMLMGEELPEPWRGRVLEAIAAVPNVTPVFEQEGQQHRDTCRKVMRAHRNLNAAAVAEFRLDDDDAIAVDFVETTRRSFRRHRRLMEERGKFALDHTRGLAMVLEKDAASLHPVFAHLWVAGLALVYPPQHRKSILDYPHKRLWMAMPNLTSPSQIGFVRGVHGSNDSAIGQGVSKLPAWPLEGIDEQEMMQDRFGIDWARLREAWAQRHGIKA